MSNEIQVTQGSDAPPRCDLCTTRARCLLAVLPGSQHDSFRSLVRERSIAVGEMVQIQGGHSQTLGVVKVGLLKGLRKSHSNGSKPIVLMGKGRLVGLTQPFGQPALLSLTAITPTRVCEVNAQAVRDFAMLYPPFEHGIYKSIADFVGCMADWARLMREASYLKKLCFALQLIAVEEGGQFFRMPSHTELANMLATRRETIARHVALLIENGTLRKTDRWHVMLTKTNCGGLQERVAAQDRPSLTQVRSAATGLHSA